MGVELVLRHMRNLASLYQNTNLSEIVSVSEISSH